MKRSLLAIVAVLSFTLGVPAWWRAREHFFIVIVQKHPEPPTLLPAEALPPGQAERWTARPTGRVDERVEIRTASTRRRSRVPRFAVF